MKMLLSQTLMGASGCLEKSDIHSLCNYWAKLSAHHSLPGIPEPHGLIEELYGLGPSNAAVDDEILINIRNKISDAKCVEKEMVAFMIASIPLVDVSYRSEYQRIVIRCCSATATLQQNEGSANAIVSGCRRARLLFQREGPLREKIDTRKMNTEKAIEHLQSVCRDVVAGDLVLLLNDGESLRPGRNVERGVKTGPGKRRRYSLGRKQTDPDDLTVVRKLYPELGRVPRGVDRYEHSADGTGAPAGAAVSENLAGKWNESTHDRHRRAQAKANAITRNSLRSSASRLVLSKGALAYLLAELMPAAQEVRHAATLTLVSVLTGESIGSVLDELFLSSGTKKSKIKVMDNQLSYVKEIKLPPSRASGRFKKMMIEAGSIVDWPLPAELVQPVRNLRCATKDGFVSRQTLCDQVTATIDSLKNGSRSSISIGRCPVVLERYLRDRKVDKADICVLCNMEPRDMPESIYHHIQQAEVAGYARDFYAWLSDISGCSLTFSRADLLSSDLLAGTQRKVHDRHIQEYVERRLEALEKSRNRPLGYLHNLALYTREAFCSASSIRPIKGQLEDRELIDWIASCVHVADKEVRSSLNSRTIKLPPLMMGILRRWDENLRVTKKEYEDVEPRISAICSEALGETGDGTTPYLFLIDGVGGNARAKRISLSNLKPFLKEDWDVDGNWYRQRQRDRVLQLTRCSAVTGAYMAHEEFGVEHNGRYSGMSAMQIEDKLACLEDSLIELGFVVPAPRAPVLVGG